MFCDACNNYHMYECVSLFNIFDWHENSVLIRQYPKTKNFIQKNIFFSYLYFKLSILKIGGVRYDRNMAGLLIFAIETLLLEWKKSAFSFISIKCISWNFLLKKSRIKTFNHCKSLFRYAQVFPGKTHTHVQRKCYASHCFYYSS